MTERSSVSDSAGGSKVEQTDTSYSQLCQHIVKATSPLTSSLNKTGVIRKFTCNTAMKVGTIHRDQNICSLLWIVSKPLSKNIWCVVGRFWVWWQADGIKNEMSTCCESDGCKRFRRHILLQKRLKPGRSFKLCCSFWCGREELYLYTSFCWHVKRKLNLRCSSDAASLMETLLCCCRVETNWNMWFQFVLTAPSSLDAGR